MASFSFPNGLPALEDRPYLFSDVNEYEDVECWARFDNGEEHYWTEPRDVDYDDDNGYFVIPVREESIWQELESLEGDHTGGFTLVLSDSII